jgi:hypothetical protein
MSGDLSSAELLKLQDVLAVCARLTLESIGTPEAAKFAELTHVIWSTYERQDRTLFVCLRKRGVL